MKDKDLGSTWTRWLVYRTSNGTLQMLHSLHNKNTIQQNSRDSRFFFASIQNTIPFIKRFGNAGCYRINSRIIKPATGGPILSGRRRTGDRTKKISNNLRRVKTKQSEQTTYPPKMRRGIMHLRGCTLRFHPRGWTPRFRIKCPPNISYRHTQLLTRIGDNQQPIGELSHHYHMLWCDAALYNTTCLKT
jgi:hypothetical protein